MLEFVLGRAGTGKTTWLREKLAAEPVQTAILLVPEQYTFECERALLEQYGVETANRIKVYSFTRLAEAAFLRYGGSAGKRLTDGGRRILMTLAIESCADHLTLFEKSAGGGRMTDVMLTAVGEMKLCGVQPDALRGAADCVQDAGLSQKLRELALIYGAFEALVQQTYLDPLDDLTRLDAVLSAHPDFFRGASVAVDAFDGFTVQEYRILTHAIRHADRVRVALCCGDLDTSKRDLFSTVRRTAARLMRIAHENGISVTAPVHCDMPFRFQNDALRAVENVLACGEGEAQAGESVCVFNGASPYEEVEFAAAEIRNLILSGAYRYKDISVVCRNAELYTGLLSAALKRWDIPAFISEARPIDAEPLMRFVLSAFEAVRLWKSDDLLNMLKTGLTVFTAEETAQLENYIFTWNLTGRAAWLSPFEKHPEGYGQPMDDTARETLQTLNNLRVRITDPLTRFADSLHDADGVSASAAVYTLLTDFEIDRTLPEFCRTLENAGRPDLSAAQLRIWDLLMEVLDQMAGVLGDRAITGEKYGKLLREIVSGEDVSDIPQSMDCITFGTADRIRQSAPRAVFLLGAVQGEFPMIPAPGGVFSDVERRALLALDLPISDALEDRMLQEKFLAYSAMCSASERLYLTYPTSVGKEAKSPGELVQAARLALPDLQVLRDLPPEFFANAPEAAFSQTASLFTANTTASETLKAVFSEMPEYAGRLSMLGGQDRMGAAQLSKETAQTLFGGGRYFSASQIETYHQCRFRYFCRYALGAKERRPAELDALEYGSLMHYLFEQIIENREQDVTAMARETLDARVRDCIRHYADENMGGFEQLSPREKYRFSRMAQTAVKLIGHVAEELRVSRFRPEYFELELQYGTPFPPLRIPTENGFVTVGGVIDRVDLYQSPHGTFVRVVDYKTGRKDFKLADVLYGLSLQMLIYLAALSKNTALQPAGVLYMPSFLTAVNSDKTESGEKLLHEAEKNLRMNGVILRDMEIVRAMEEDVGGRFIPVTLLKSGDLKQSSALLTEPALQLVMRYVERLIATMAQTLAAGDVAAKPLMQNINACAWCPYTAVCGSERREDSAESVAMKNDEVLAHMEYEVKGGNAHGGKMD
ncbi:MAG: PD-(D/E)XK nuclease family protein [Ruminococcus bromii]|nr:PD-(D/E)XK nuclease family protein [Ruminococcus bromii]